MVGREGGAWGVIFRVCVWDPLQAKKALETLDIRILVPKTLSS